MMMIRTTIFTVIFTLLVSTIFAADPCRFEYPEKGIIDLTTLGRTDGKATYENWLPSTGSDYRYSYNPCKPFSEGSFCGNVAACQIGVDGMHVYAIGTQESASWNPGAEAGDGPSITYTAGERRTIVKLQCSTSETEGFEAFGEGPVNIYLFRLTHKCACWNGCSDSTTTTTTAITTTTTAPPTTSAIVDSCRFEYPEKGVIDITTLGRTDGKPAYEDRVSSPPTKYKYSYNPCKPFSEGSVCQNVAACQLDGGDAYALGTQQSALWNPGAETGGVPSVVYIYGEKTVVVMLQCSTNGTEEFEVLGEDPMNVYIFRLTSKCACWNGCSGTSSTTTTIAPTTPTPVPDSCRFEYPGKGVIDFSFIGRTDEKAAYTDEMTRTVSNYKYSYNPCRSFSEGTGCIGVSVCQISNDEQRTVTLGTQESSSWNPGSDENDLPSVNYVYADKKVSVVLECSTEGKNEFQAYGEDPVNTFKFHLTHKCACWNGCGKIPTRSPIDP